MYFFTKWQGLRVCSLEELTLPKIINSRLISSYLFFFQHDGLSRESSRKRTESDEHPKSVHEQGKLR